MVVASPLTQLDRVLGFGSQLARSWKWEQRGRRETEREGRLRRQFDCLKFRQLHIVGIHNWAALFLQANLGFSGPNLKLQLLF